MFRLACSVHNAKSWCGNIYSDSSNRTRSHAAWLPHRIHSLWLINRPCQALDSRNKSPTNLIWDDKSSKTSMRQSRRLHPHWASAPRGEGKELWLIGANVCDGIYRLRVVKNGEVTWRVLQHQSKLLRWTRIRPSSSGTEHKNHFHS